MALVCTTLRSRHVVRTTHGNQRSVTYRNQARMVLERYEEHRSRHDTYRVAVLCSMQIQMPVRPRNVLEVPGREALFTTATHAGMIMSRLPPYTTSQLFHVSLMLASSIDCCWLGEFSQALSGEQRLAYSRSQRAFKLEPTMSQGVAKFSLPLSSSIDLWLS